MQSIRDWLKTHPAEAMAWMQKNPRYIFFEEVTGDGPLGAMGVALTAGRSLAVDPDFLPLGVPVWLDTAWPIDTKVTKAGAPMQRLMVAQDVGNAIKGPVRGDVFWGSGDTALDFAGHMKNPGRYFLLLPKPVAERNTLTVTDILSQQ
jgi:membrane-bound lytic murein transglycosylase A